MVETLFFNEMFPLFLILLNRQLQDKSVPKSETSGKKRLEHLKVAAMLKDNVSCLATKVNPCNHKGKIIGCKENTEVLNEASKKK